MGRRVAPVLGAICLATPAAQAQEPASRGFPFDPVEVDSSHAPGAMCYLSHRHIVVERRQDPGIRTDFFVRPRTTGRCQADSLLGDYVLRDEWAAYFAALIGDVLFVDSGTGPDIRYLVLFDLAKRRRLAELPYVEMVPVPDSTVVGLWQGYELDEPLPDCAAPRGGLVPGVDSLFFLEVRTGETRFAGRTRCAQRQ